MAARGFADESSVVESSTTPVSSQNSSSSMTSPVSARRGRGRGRGRASNRGSSVSHRQRGRGRGARRQRGRTWTATELAAAQTCRAQRSDNLTNMVQEMTADELRELVLSIAERHSSLVLDMASNLSRESVAEEPSSSAAASPSWCTCHHCQDMGSDIENQCCRMQPQHCTSQRPEMTLMVLDSLVLHLQQQYRRDIFARAAEGAEQSNKCFRHAAYRQFVLWQNGRLTAGDRRVIPSCCVLAIRQKYPDPNGRYRGFDKNHLIGW